MDVDMLVEMLEQCDPSFIEFSPHFHERARRRNVDAEGVKRKVREYDFVDVRPNPQNDLRFEHAFRVTVNVDGALCEMPIYFNVPGTKILVKSVWPR